MVDKISHPVVLASGEHCPVRRSGIPQGKPTQQFPGHRTCNVLWPKRPFVFIVRRVQVTDHELWSKIKIKASVTELLIVTFVSISIQSEKKKTHINRNEGKLEKLFRFNQIAINLIKLQTVFKGKIYNDVCSDIEHAYFKHCVYTRF